MELVFMVTVEAREEVFAEEIVAALAAKFGDRAGKIEVEPMDSEEDDV